MPEQTLNNLLEELRRRATLLSKDHIVIMGQFQASVARPDCAWIEILVDCQGYKVMHDFASVVKGTGHRHDTTWAHPDFSLVLMTPTAGMRF